MALPYQPELLDALGAWIRGWREKTADRVSLFETLAPLAAQLPSRARSTKGVCYRKRYLYNGDLTALFVGEELAEDGGTSWTTRRDFAEAFHGAWRDDAVTAAIFRHTVRRKEVVVSVDALYQDTRFTDTLQEYIAADCAEAEAFRTIGNRQGEVILIAPLRVSEIVGLTGWASDFEMLCKAAGLTSDEEIDRALTALRKKGVDPLSPRWVSNERAQVVVQKTIAAWQMKLAVPAE